MQGDQHQNSGLDRLIVWRGRSILRLVDRLEPFNCFQQPITQMHLGLPVQGRLRQSDIRPALKRVISRKGLVRNLAIDLSQFKHEFRQFHDREFRGISNVFLKFAVCEK